MALNHSALGGRVTATKAAYDDLRSDVLEHTHDGDDTATIDHEDLVGRGTTYTHSDIDNHIAASSAVHGGDSGEYVLTGKDTQKIIRRGSVNVPDIENNWNNSVYVWFNSGHVDAFGKTPSSIICRLYDPVWGQVIALRTILSDISKKGFRIHTYGFASGQGIYRCHYDSYTSTSAGTCPRYKYETPDSPTGYVWCNDSFYPATLYWAPPTSSQKITWSAMGDRYA